MLQNMAQAHDRDEHFDEPHSECEDCREEARVDAITRREDAFEYEGVILKGLVV